MINIIDFNFKTKSNLKQSQSTNDASFWCQHMKCCFLFICKMKTLKLEVIFKSWWRKVCSYATHCTWWKRDSDFFAKDTPAPSDKLTIGYVPVKFILPTFIWLRILLFVLVPGCLQHPSVDTNSLETWMLSYTNWGFSNRPHLYWLPVFVANLHLLRKFWTAGTFLISA